MFGKWSGNWFFFRSFFIWWQIPNLREPLRHAKILFFLRAKYVFFRKLPLRIGSLFASNQKVHRPRSQSFLHFDIWNMYQIHSEIQFSSARRFLSAALLERWPQVCRVKITFSKLPTNCFVSTTKISMKCVVDWIQLRIRIRLRNAQPHHNHWTKRVVSTQLIA